MQLTCPNCGAGHELVNPGIAMLVCQHCDTLVLRDGENVTAAGERAILAEGDTRLFMSATGRLDGVGYRVAGHLRYSFGDGTWDEWYLALDDGTTAWLSEDARQLTLERPVPTPPGLPPADGLELSDLVSLGDDRYSVRERGEATMVGGEGQLPFRLLPGEHYPFFDLATRDGLRFATLEYDEDEAPTAFLGEPLGHDRVTVEDERPPSFDREAGSAIDCTNCGGVLDAPTFEGTRTLVCAFCGAALDLTSAEHRVLGINPADPGFDLELGAAGELDGKRWTVMARQYFEEVDAWGTYPSRTYLLHNPNEGQVWLDNENDHWVLARPTRIAPDVDPYGFSPKVGVKVGSETFLYYEEGETTLRYVDGALPWLAEVGDVTGYCDLIQPPRLYTVEKSPGELEYVLGEYLPKETVEAAFGVQLPRPHGMHPAQPGPKPIPLLSALTGWGIFFAVVNLAVGMFLFTSYSGQTLMQQTFGREVYQEAQLTHSFQIPPGPLVDVRLSAPVDNQWVHGSFALVDENLAAIVAEGEQTIEYYHGYDDGNWSEGSQDQRIRLRSPGPGLYQLALVVECPDLTGVPAHIAAQKRDRCPDKVQVRVTGGTRAMELSFIGMALCLIVGVGAGMLQFFRHVGAETLRWSAVIEDDD